MVMRAVGATNVFKAIVYTGQQGYCCRIFVYSRTAGKLDISANILSCYFLLTYFQTQEIENVTKTS